MYLLKKHLNKSFLAILAVTVVMGVVFNVYIYWSSANESKNIKGLNKIYTVKDITKTCANNKCTSKVIYAYQDIEKSISINEPSFKVGDQVYERLVCKRVNGPDKGKIYDPRNIPESEQCIHSILIKSSFFSVLSNSKKSCGGICTMQFQGAYTNDVPN